MVKRQTTWVSAVMERLDAGLDKSGDCWLWTGGVITVHGRSYGRFSIKGHRFYVHRLAYMRWIGGIPDGSTVYQTCGDSLCCNPEHLRSS